MGRTLIIGDSFVEGVGADERGGWARQYADRADGHVTVSGEGGDNTIDLLNRLGDHESNGYGSVVVEIGLNDSRFRPSRRGQEVPVDEFNKNVATIIKRCADTGAQVTLLGLTRVDEAKTTPYKEDKHYRNFLIDQYDEALRAVALECGADYVPVPALADEPGNLFDGLHPSPAGHAKLLAAFIASLRT